MQAIDQVLASYHCCFILAPCVRTWNPQATGARSADTPLHLLIAPCEPSIRTRPLPPCLAHDVLALPPTQAQPPGSHLPLAPRPQQRPHCASGRCWRLLQHTAPPLPHWPHRGPPALCALHMHDEIVLSREICYNVKSDSEGGFL